MNNHHAHQNNKLVIAGANIANMSPAIITAIAAKNILYILAESAADMYQNTTKCNAADMFHNTIVKQNAAKYLSTMMYKIAKHAKDGYAIKNADMFQDTIGNMYANLNAHNHAQALAHQDNAVLAANR